MELATYRIKVDASSIDKKRVEVSVIPFLRNPGDRILQFAADVDTHSKTKAARDKNYGIMDDRLTIYAQKGLRGTFDLEISMSNQTMVFAERPTEAATASTFRLDECAMPECPTDGIMIRATHFSVDPYMRGRMAEGKSYAPGWEVGSPGEGGMCGIVVESNDPELVVGDAVTGFGQWNKFIAASKVSFRKIEVSDAVPASAYLGQVGMPGLSAYFPLEKIAKPQPDEVVFVSGAAGAVGSTVGQICKNVKGCRVIGCAGTDEKVEFLKSLGFDEAFNYNTMSVAEALDTYAPEGIDVYWDNVGGETLDEALARMKKFGRIVACGAISQYNNGTEAAYGLKNTINVVKQQLLWQGFIVTRWAEEFPEGLAELAKLVGEGKLQIKETVVNGFENIPTAFMGLFTGVNVGKMVVKVD